MTGLRLLLNPHINAEAQLHMLAADFSARVTRRLATSGAGPRIRRADEVCNGI